MSWEKAVADGIREAQLGHPAPPPQKQNEPADLHNARVNSFEWQKKQQNGK
jgi:hypothetical protein